jgi:Tol biopolymer transport system component
MVDDRGGRVHRIGRCLRRRVRGNDHRSGGPGAPPGRIVFDRQDPSGQSSVTFMVNADGTDLRRLYPGASGNPRWSPDGSRVSVEAACRGGGECAATIVDPRTDAFRQFQFADPTLETFCSIWTPDGKRLACEGHGIKDARRNGIYTIRASDGSGLTRVTANPGGDDLPIDFSADGRLLFTRTDPSRPSSTNAAFFVANADGSHSRRITPWGTSDDDGGWSPDGSKIVFEQGGSLVTIRPDGGGQSRIHLDVPGSVNAFDAAWSPDGSGLVFALQVETGPNAGREGIATANPDGTDVRMVTTSPSRDEKPDWGRPA